MTGEPLNPLRAPRLALDAQVDTLRWVQDRGAAAIANLDSAAERPLIHDAQRGDRAAHERLHRALRRSVAGRTLWMSSHAATMVEHASASIPPPDGGQISAGTIPEPAGMMWLSGDPAMCLHEHPVRAVSWVVTPWPDVALGGARVVAPSAVIWPWIDHDNPVRPSPAPPVVVPLSADAAQMLDDDEPWTEARVAWDEGTWRSESREIVRWTLAMWVMCGQVLPRLIVPASRPQRRRRARLRDVPPISDLEVHVTTLRVIDQDEAASEDGPQDARHHHQWVVRGHWRWQPCGPGRKDRRLTWIAPHVKGPEGAPLLEVEQVGKLVR